MNGRGPTDRELLDGIELGPRVAPALEHVGERREVRFAGIRFGGRWRRPSGTPAPLPRPLNMSGRLWLVAAVSMMFMWLSIFLWPALADWWTRRDHALLLWLTNIRSDAATAFARRAQFLFDDEARRALRLGCVLALVIFRRWRHLLAALGSFFAAGAILNFLLPGFGRPRPFVEIAGRWLGPAHPSAVVAGLTLTLVVAGYSLIPEGRWRRRWFVFSASTIAVLSLVQMYLGVDHPTDDMVGALFGAAVGVTVFRLFVPDASFPISYARGRKAHLDITGARGAAIERALRDQLGLEVLETKLVGLESSAGSTPIRLTVAGEGGDMHLFAKLYATSHLRADRWYKLARRILYGSLEDEVRFASVSRLVEYEDYMLRIMRDAGVPSAAPFGIVELTPEREYLIVTEFFDNARELGDSEITGAVIDNALHAIRRLWDGHLAHRDLKPANVMVLDEAVQLIDMAFGTARPTPWRQAVDLANMMLTLALHGEPERVYRRALLQFAPEDIAEAFAATKGVTVPSQVRHGLRERKRRDGLDLIEEFRRLAPERKPISIQRWNAQRVRLTVAALAAAAGLVWLAVQNFRGAGFL